MSFSHINNKLKHLSKLNSLPLFQTSSSCGPSSFSAQRYSVLRTVIFNEKSYNFVLLNSKLCRKYAKRRLSYPDFSSGLCSNFNFDMSNGYLLSGRSCSSHCGGHVRWFCDSVENVKFKRRDNKVRQFESRKKVSEIIEVVRRNGGDVEAELDSMNVSLSVSSIAVIFRALSRRKVSLLRFFNWVRERWPEYGRNADVCSLIISNCGWLGDYDTMVSLLSDFSSNQIFLSKRAFDFMAVVMSRKSGTMGLNFSVEQLVKVMNKVGGSCRSSGICALLEVFSQSGWFDLCKYVIENTDNRLAYYKIVLKEICLKCDFEGALEILNEMKRSGRDPDTNIYNYILSRLLEAHTTAEPSHFLEKMIKLGLQPDELTYEILICFYCKHKQVDYALQFYDQMVSHGLTARLTTHAAFIKYYFNLQQYEEAYKYLSNLTDEHRRFANKLYSMLVNLHSKKQNYAIAHKILSDMINEGLRPESRLYTRVSDRLRNSGREDLVRDLENKLSSLTPHSSLEG